MSSLRGMHSTGILALRHEKGRLKGRISKEATDSIAFINSKDHAPEISRQGVFGILGHTRFATVGAVNEDNAQPVNADRIIGCHNGTVRYFADQIKEGDNMSDSRLLIRHIFDEGLQETINKSRSGAYALTYVDFDTLNLNIIRNSQRDLWYTKSGITLMWASEPDMLRLVVNRNELHGFCEPVQFKTDELYTLNLNKINIKDFGNETTEVKPEWCASFRKWQQEKKEEKETKAKVTRYINNKWTPADSKEYYQARKSNGQKLLSRMTKEQKIERANKVKGLNCVYNEDLKRVEYWEYMGGFYKLIFISYNGIGLNKVEYDQQTLTLGDKQRISNDDALKGDWLDDYLAIAEGNEDNVVPFDPLNDDAYEITDQNGSYYNKKWIMAKCKNDGCVVCGQKLDPYNDVVYMTDHGLLLCEDHVDADIAREFSPGDRTKLKLRRCG